MLLNMFMKVLYVKRTFSLHWCNFWCCLYRCMLFTIDKMFVCLFCTKHTNTYRCSLLLVTGTRVTVFQSRDHHLSFILLQLNFWSNLLYILPSGFHCPWLSDSYARSARSEEAIITVRVSPWNWTVSAWSETFLLRDLFILCNFLFFFLETLFNTSNAFVWPSHLLLRPPERRHGYEQQFHSITAQSEHESLEAKRPRMESVAEAHIIRTPPTAGDLVLPITHTMQDSLRATVEVKKVSPVSCLSPFLSHLCVCVCVCCFFIIYCCDNFLTADIYCLAQVVNS